MQVMLPLMKSRVNMLLSTAEGYEQSGAELITVNDTGDPLLGRFLPAGYQDDIGIYYLIPKLSRLLGQDVISVAEAFFPLVIILFATIGTIGILLAVNDRRARSYGVFVLSIVSALTYRYGDVYVFYSAFTLGFGPWWLYFRKRLKSPWLFVYFSLIGVVGVFFHYARGYSSIPLMVLMAIDLSLLARGNFTLRYLAKLAPLFLSIGFTFLFFSYLEASRDNILRSYDPGHVSRGLSHPFWHSIYVGLGAIDNPYGISWHDQVAVDKAISVRENVRPLSEEYEAILRDQVLSLVRNDPAFILEVIGFKLAKIFIYILLFLNVALYWLRKTWRTHVLDHVPYVTAAAFAAAPGIATMPFRQYLLGLFAITALWATAIIDRHVNSLTRSLRE